MGADMLEVEVKYRYAEWDTFRAKLTAIGARLAESRTDVDHYFNAPDRDFAKTDEAVRIRRIGDANCITYKGPKTDTATKTRTEIELTIEAGDAGADTATRLLTALGYRSVRVISKSREVWKFTRDGFDLEACLDDAGSLGQFVELEVLAEPDRFEAAKAVVLRTAAELGLSEVEPRSYLAMHLAAGES